MHLAECLLPGRPVHLSVRIKPSLHIQKRRLRNRKDLPKIKEVEFEFKSMKCHVHPTPGLCLAPQTARVLHLQLPAEEDEPSLFLQHTRVRYQHGYSLAGPWTRSEKPWVWVQVVLGLSFLSLIKN